MPLQIAQQMDQQGRVRGASLAYEAAARVSAAHIILHNLSKHKRHVVNLPGYAGTLFRADGHVKSVVAQSAADNAGTIQRKPS